MKLQLRPMNLNDAEAEYAYFQNMPEENGFRIPYKGMTHADFLKRAIPERIQIAHVNPPQLPNTYYFLWADNTLVGLFVVRPVLDAELRRMHGHIGYGILPQFRGQGFASMGLALALRECDRQMPADEGAIELICDITNPASLQVMRKNGGHVFRKDATDYFVHIPRTSVQNK